MPTLVADPEEAFLEDPGVGADWQRRGQDRRGAGLRLRARARSHQPLPELHRQNRVGRGDQRPLGDDRGAALSRHRLDHRWLVRRVEVDDAVHDVAGVERHHLDDDDDLLVLLQSPCTRFRRLRPNAVLQLPTRNTAAAQLKQQIDVRLAGRVCSA